MSQWKRWIAVIAIAGSLLGVAACDGGDVEDPDQVEQQVDEGTDNLEDQVDELEQDVRENTP